MRPVAKTATLILFSLMLAAAAFAASPVVSNVRASQRAGTKLVDITYDLADPDSVSVMVLLRMSSDGGTTWRVSCPSVSGNGVGDAVVPGGAKSIVWDAGADWDGQWSDQMRVEVTASDLPTTGDYWVIDLAAGPDAMDYSVSLLTAVPVGGWTDEYKTTKLVLRRIPAGTFTMGSPEDELGHRSDETQHQVTLTAGFYLGVFEVTQKQYERVMGTWPSYLNNTACRDTRPVETVSYNSIRGSSSGAGWPTSGSVDATSFMGRLRERTGLATLDLPTEAQWEYACRAETVTELNSGKSLTDRYNCPNMAELGRYWYNGGSVLSQTADTSVGTAKVGSYLPNAWGLYDMHANVYELCLDWYGTYPQTVTDPRGALSGSTRVARGGGFRDYASSCRSAARGGSSPDTGNYGFGFRVCSAAPVQ